MSISSRSTVAMSLSSRSVSPTRTIKSCSSIDSENAFLDAFVSEVSLDESSIVTTRSINQPLPKMMIVLVDPTGQSAGGLIKKPDFLSTAREVFAARFLLPITEPVRLFSKIGGRQLEVLDEAAWDLVEHMADVSTSKRMLPFHVSIGPHLLFQLLRRIWIRFPSPRLSVLRHSVCADLSQTMISGPILSALPFYVQLAKLFAFTSI